MEQLQGRGCLAERGVEGRGRGRGREGLGWVGLGWQAWLWGFLIKVGLVVPLMKVQAGGLLRSATLMALGGREVRMRGGRAAPSLAFGPASTKKH